jgi:hypothetical protein
MKKGDVLVIAITVLVSIVSMFFLMLNNDKMDKKLVVLKVGGQKVKEISIDNTTKEKYDFKFDNNIGYMEVKDGKVRLLKMDKKICPKQICSKTGWIDKKYETIVCLPNKITVNFEENRTAEVDDVVF